ncbi:hypothetical protein FHS31_002158 [Sphingomonas vulcanisoli]|uniref:Uncharacterized protein n=1 Tax=Sphingomonas vulcanisoli TaxID=1658060 RepID=A0ABX0TST4_9SPHN|nr:hypothetical protein [Sphingomonas vulcanisoli]NIJ08537.1 hypothetical protein [Sphingomonas vulcanisoli]
MSDPKTYDPMRARVPKGERPTFFDDPSIDRLWWVTLALLGEVTTLRDRLDAHERLAARHGLFTAADVDTFEATEDEAAARAAERQALVERTLRAITIEVEAARRAGAEGQRRVQEDEDASPSGAG